MFWTGFFIGVAASLVIGLTAILIRDRRQRSAFIAGLSRAERERLKGFETVQGNWRAFRDLMRSHRETHGVEKNRYSCG
jgi:hypothetical protein